jgi:hypothetical protein
VAETSIWMREEGWQISSQMIQSFMILIENHNHSRLSLVKSILGRNLSINCANLKSADLKSYFFRKIGAWTRWWSFKLGRAMKILLTSLDDSFQRDLLPLLFRRMSPSDSATLEPWMIPRKDLRGKVWYGETEDGSSPRGYSDRTRLITRERLPQEEVITQFDICKGTYSGVQHHWVVFQTHSGQWYSVENIGILLFQKVADSDHGRLYTKDPTSTRYQPRDGSPERVGPISPTSQRNISQFVDWLMRKKMIDPLMTHLRMICVSF